MIKLLLQLSRFVLDSRLRGNDVTVRRPVIPAKAGIQAKVCRMKPNECGDHGFRFAEKTLRWQSH